jgi:hypothetical protein
MSAAEEMAKEVESATEDISGNQGTTRLPLRDLSLKEGEKIHVAVKNHSHSISKKATASSKPSGGGFLRPPPPAGSIVKPALEPTVDPSTETEDDSADWGDFTSSETP